MIERVVAYVVLALAIVAAFVGLARADYESVVTADAPCHWYKMQETSGTTLADSPVAGGCGAADMTTVGTPSLSQATTGVVNKTSVGFNGSTQYARYTEGGGGCGLGLDKGNWSWEVWGRVHGNGSGGAQYGVPFSSYGPSITGWLFYLITTGSPANKTARFNTFNSGGGTYINTASVSASGVLDQWYYLAATWALSGTTLKLYLNGVLEDTQTTTSGSAGCAQNIDVADENGGSEGLNGNVQYPAIYKSTLSAAQILSHYNAGITAATSGTFPYTVRYFERPRRIEPRLLRVSMPSLALDVPGFIIDKLNRTKPQGLYGVSE